MQTRPGGDVVLGETFPWRPGARVVVRASSLTGPARPQLTPGVPTPALWASGREPGSDQRLTPHAGVCPLGLRAVPLLHGARRQVLCGPTRPPPGGVLVRCRPWRVRRPYFCAVHPYPHCPSAHTPPQSPPPTPPLHALIGGPLRAGARP
jgi:hypothetical protein